MKIKNQNLISTIITAIIFFFFRDEQPQPEIKVCSNISSTRCILLDEKNIKNLEQGEWIVISNKHINLESPRKQPYNKDVAVIILDSVKKIEIAARLGMKDFKRPLFLKDGVVKYKKADASIKQSVSFIDILDYYVYVWAIDLRKMVATARDVNVVLDKTLFSLIKMLFDLTNLYASK